MSDEQLLADQFERNRDHLRAVAHRMLGSAADADDAVQDAWLRLQRADTSEVENLRGWLTTVVARVCLDRLRSRTARREDALDVSVDERPARPGAIDPETEAQLADSVGLALLVVLEALAPVERLAFVLHDLFAVPFDEIAPIVGRTPTATRQLASRARRRVHGAPAVDDGDQARRRRVVEAFMAASRAGDFEGLLAVLDPDVVRRADPEVLRPGQHAEVRGARLVARQAMAARSPVAELALVDGSPAIIVAHEGHLRIVLTFTVEDERITEIEVIATPERLASLDVALL